MGVLNPPRASGLSEALAGLGIADQSSGRLILLSSERTARHLRAVAFRAMMRARAGRRRRAGERGSASGDRACGSAR
jgi:hypothetical protein